MFLGKGHTIFFAPSLLFFLLYISIVSLFFFFFFAVRDWRILQHT